MSLIINCYQINTAFATRSIKRAPIFQSDISELNLPAIYYSINVLNVVELSLSLSQVDRHVLAQKYLLFQMLSNCFMSAFK